MDKNVIIKFIAESEIDDIMSDMEQFKLVIDNLIKKLEGLQAEQKKGSVEWEYYAGMIEGVKEEFKDINAEVSKSGKSITEYAKNFSKINEKIAEGALSTPKFTTQLRQLKDELAKLEAEGIDPTDKGFISLAVRAAEMEDQIGDTRQRIAHLASDTKNLDAAMSLGSGLAGAFSVATSTAALLGRESEELQQAFFKVQAALSILNGVQQVANVLNKDSIANVVIGTAVEDANTISKIKNSVAKRANAAVTALETKAKAGSIVATKAATVAQWALNAAMKANPAGLVLTAIMALVGAYSMFANKARDAKRAQAEFNAELAGFKRISDQRQKDLEKEVDLMQASGSTEEEVLNYRRKKNEEFIKASEDSLAKLKNKYDKARGKAKKELSSKLDEASAIVQNYYNERDKINHDFDVLSRKRAKDASDKARELAKQSHEKAINDAKQRAQEIKKAEIDLHDAIIAQMQDGQFKEIEQIRVNYERKIAEVKGYSETEIELRKQLTQLMNREIQAVEIKYAQEETLRAKELEMLKAQNAAAGSAKSIALKKEVLRHESELEIQSIKNSEDNEAIKAEKIKAVRLKLKSDLAEIDNEILRQEHNIALLKLKERISLEKHNAEIVLASNKSTLTEKYKAKEKIFELEKQQIAEEGDLLKFQLENDLITVTEYEESVLELKEKNRELDLERIRAKAESEKEIQKAVFDLGIELMQLSFDFRRTKLEQEMEYLENHYVLAEEGAKKRADQEFITEQALAKKKLEIRQKQARAEKAQALFQIGINTAQAIMKIWADVPKLDFGASTIALTAIATALGAAQAIAVASKPLPKYARGRKGGKGELAMVGELGPEIMWIPNGASIVPNGKKLTPNVMEMFGIPKLWDVDKNIREYSDININKGHEIDYEKLGKAVANNIKYPKNNPVTVNVDKSGVTISEGNFTTTYLNKKYKGEW